MQTAGGRAEEGRTWRGLGTGRRLIPGTRDHAGVRVPVRSGREREEEGREMTRSERDRAMRSAVMRMQIERLPTGD